MDTATHIVIGFGLAGLATLDPAVAGSAATMQAVTLATVVGSVIPDIDTVLKLKNNALYIRNHRGMTHSLPFLAMWSLLLATVLSLAIPGSGGASLYLWSLAAVSLHVFSDIFNAYGTQAARPASQRWIALGIINIFDPFIFSLHILGFLLWLVDGHPGQTFATIYGVIIVYYVLRTWQHHRTIQAVRRQLPGAVNILLSPTLRWSRYHICAASRTRYYVGKMDGTKLQLIDTFVKQPVDLTSEVMCSALNDKNVRAFLSFSPMYRWSISERKHHWIVQFTDLRYVSKGVYTFTATAEINQDLSVRSSYTGWVFSEQKLEKKLVPTHVK
ncbi:MAG: metal-dependent hydrolase [Sporolactobacillus sp.]